MSTESTTVTIGRLERRKSVNVFAQVHGFWAFLVVLAASFIAAMSTVPGEFGEVFLRLSGQFFLAFLVLNFGSMLVSWPFARKHKSG